jgi:hypothetical protein
VPDHLTVPPVTYDVYLADPLKLSLPSNLTDVVITRTLFVNGTFLVEFPTQADDRYYIQYDSTPDFAHPLTVFPAVVGTGSRVQWIDDGPPKTVSPPGNGSRFYRVFQSP